MARTFKFQQLLYQSMTTSELTEVVSNPDKYLQYYVTACQDELNTRK